MRANRVDLEVEQRLVHRFWHNGGPGEVHDRVRPRVSHHGCEPILVSNIALPEVNAVRDCTAMSPPQVVDDGDIVTGRQ